MAAVWVYWLGVLIMGIRARLQGVRSAGLIPSQTIERIMWLIWVPVIAGWIIFPWLTISRGESPWLMPQWALVGEVWLSLRWLAAAITWVCFGATVYCWRWMGRNWRVGVTEDDPTELITSGPFGRVRHPIYAISILMIWCTLLAAPSWPLLVSALLHTVLMNLKARNEERWMVNMHGETYIDYRRRTNRFIPAFR
jgi:hypothetical protein